MTDRKASLCGAGLVCALVFLTGAGMLRESLLQASLLTAVSVAAAAVLWGCGYTGQTTRLAALLFAGFCSVRYLRWRVLTVLVFFFGLDATHEVRWWRAMPALLVLGAEIFALGALLVRCVQGLRPLRRRPVRLPSEVSLWPDVDVMITAGPESLAVVRTTVLAALNMDWPAAKLKVFVFEREPRAELQQFCAEVGCSYLAGGEGNAREWTPSLWAWQPLRAPVLAVLRAGHAPVRSFLQVTMGWMERDPRVAVVQTAWPLGMCGGGTRLDRLRPEQVTRWNGLQDGLDFWGAVKFAGSAAVVRRAALVPVPEGELLAGRRTGFELNAGHWTTAYVHVTQVASAASEKDHWLAGAPEAPHGATWPRAVFLLVPAAYLLGGWVSYPGTGRDLVTFGLPLLLFMALTDRILEERSWSALARPIAEASAITMQLCRALRKLRPRSLGPAVQEDETGRELRVSTGLLLLSVLSLAAWNGVALLRGAAALLCMAVFSSRHEPAGDIVMTSLQTSWAGLNLLVLGGALRAMAPFWPRRRRAVRIALHSMVEVTPIRGLPICGRTEDASMGGARLVLNEPAEIAAGEWLHVKVEGEAVERPLLAQVVKVCHGTGAQQLSVAFRALPLEEEEELARWLYGRADRWIRPQDRFGEDSSRTSIRNTVCRSLSGYRIGWVSLQAWVTGARWRAVCAWAGLILLIAGGFMLSREHTLPQGAADQSVPVRIAADRAAAKSMSAQPHHTARGREISLDPTSSGALLLSLSKGSGEQLYVVPATDVVEKARLALTMHCGAAVKGGMLTLSWNDVQVGMIPLSDRCVQRMQDTGEAPTLLSLPPELVVSRNNLTVRLQGQTGPCRETPCPEMWVRLEARLLARLIPLAPPPLPVGSRGTLPDLSNPSRLERAADLPVRDIRGLLRSGLSGGLRRAGLPFSVLVLVLVPVVCVCAALLLGMLVEHQAERRLRQNS